MRKFYLPFLVILMLMSVNLFAQVAAYTFASGSGTYAPVTGGTAIKYGNPVTSASVGTATLDDDVYYNRAIGFNFVYNGASYSSFGFNSNGWLIFGNSTAVTNSTAPISSTTAIHSNIVAAASADLIGGIQVGGSVTSGGNSITANASSPTAGVNIGDSVTGTGIPTPGAVVTAVNATSITVDKTLTSGSTSATWRIKNGEIRYETIGVGITHTLVLQFTGFSRFSTTAPGDRMNFQIRLNETTNTVQVVYGTWSATSTGTLAVQVGLKGVNSNDFNNRTTGTNWAATTAGTLNTSNILYNNTVYPASGLTYTWTAPSCAAPTVFTSSAITTTSATVSWNAVPGVSQYEYEVRTSGAAGSGASGLTTSGTVATNTVNLSALSAGTGYTFFARSVCGAGNNSAWSAVFVFETTCGATAGNIPYSQNFDAITAPALPACIVVENVNADANAWATTATTFTGSTAPNVMRYSYSSTNAADDWFFIKGLNLTAGVKYSISFKYSGTGYVEKLEVKVGSAANSSSMEKTALFVNENITSVGDGGGVYTPITTGVYYFGFHVYSAADQFALYVDNINVTVAPALPGCTTNISPVNGATNVPGPPTLSWNTVAAATSYDLFFSSNGTTYDSLGNTSLTSVSITGTTANTTYYWYARPRNASGAAVGCQSSATNFTTAGAPANDSCGASTLLAANTIVNATTSFATSSLPSISCGGFTSSAPTGDVWFRFTTTAGGAAAVSVTNSAGTFDPIIVVYSGVPTAGCGGLTYVNCADATVSGGSETATLTGLAPATTYYIRVYGYAASGANSFSIQVTGDALPIALSDFRGERKGAVNALSWTTASEQNNAGFELQRSVDGRNYSSLGFIASKASGGNSNAPLQYNFDDVKPTGGTNYYRLNQLDKDGKGNLSSVVTIKGIKANKLELLTVYPNPAMSVLNLILTSPSNDKIDIIVTDLAGKTLIQKPVQVVSGENTISVKTAGLPSGSYLIKAVCGNGCETAVSKFLKQ